MFFHKLAFLEIQEGCVGKGSFECADGLFLVSQHILQRKGQRLREEGEMKWG